MDVQSVALVFSTGVMSLKWQKQSVPCPPCAGTVCARIRVSCRVVSVCRLHGVRTYRMGGHCQQPPRPGGALNSVPDVFVHSLFQSGKPCKRLGLHSFAPAVCCAALSVLVCRLCPAVVTHCLCRGTLGELEVMLMVPWIFVTSVAVTNTVHVRANLVIRTAEW